MCCTFVQGGSEGSAGKGGMPCTLCPHPKCKHSMIRQGVSSCPECDNGTLVLDPVSAPKWRVDCNRCSFLIYLPADLHNAKLSKEHCGVSSHQYYMTRHSAYAHPHHLET